jgi:NAD(P)-dependent dehydrogenase (short-subunit alcohol dehydrogenase family)
MLGAMDGMHLTIVTGSSRGLGAALAEQRLRPGHRVLGIARGLHADLPARAASTGAVLEQWTLDLAEPLAAAARLRTWLHALEGPAFASATLVNNAGTVGVAAPLDRVPLAELSRALRVGLEAALLLSAAFVDATHGWPGARRVLNVSSGLGRFAIAGSAAYCAAKAGMDNFTRALALEQAARPNGVRAESIAPGVIDTGMQAELRAADAALFPERQRFVELHAGGRLQSAEATAERLLARLERPDFGLEPVTDLRDV